MKIQSPRIAILSLVGSLTLSACSTSLSGLPGTLNSVVPAGITTHTVAASGLLANAKSKRAIPVNTSTSSGGSTGNTTSGSAVAPTAPTTTPAMAPQPQAAEKMAADIAIAPSGSAISAPRMGLMMPYYGGGEFNNYTVTFAEENIYPGAKTTSLLQTYTQVIQPILKEWDAKARLLESRGNLVRTSSNDESNIEYVYLPGKDPNQNIKLRPDWVFRFSSTPLKETLQIYVMGDETRVIRNVWGEPNVDISKVKIDSDQALELARKAFANRDKVSYPVYPESQQIDSRSQIIYDIPAQVNWRINLNQQESNLRYFLSFDYKEGTETTTSKPDTPVMVMPANTATATVSAPATSVVTASPTLVTGSTTPAVEYRCIEPAMPTVQYFSGSLTMNAVTGEIEQLNRPVRYSYDTPKCAPVPVPMPMPLPPDATSGSSGSSGGGVAIGMPVPGSSASETVVMTSTATPKP